MPGRDGTGPAGFGPLTGRGQGRRANRPDDKDFCVCPACATKLPHRRAVPCFSLTCPRCGQKMTRL